ncbi:MAG: hypothetical protein JW990_18175, partial [Thermoleophilia bacterium]|nr:hypothetical protein [Thermoleophilia bacterium]
MLIGVVAALFAISGWTVDCGQALGASAAPASDSRHIAAIVYLDADGLPPNTLEQLAGLRATEVYLYVAYYSDVYYSIPDNPYGLAEPRDTLGAAITQLHAAGCEVTAVISSALLDSQQAPPAGLAILQDPTSSIVDPERAGSFIEDLTRALVLYDIDGVYFGEPYWITPTTDPAEMQQFNDLYERLLAITAAAGVPFKMIL